MVAVQARLTLVRGWHCCGSGDERRSARDGGLQGRAAEVHPVEGEAGMRRLLLARTVLALIGVAVWGWGYRIDDAQVRLIGIVILAVTLLLRFVPKQWLGEEK